MMGTGTEVMTRRWSEISQSTTEAEGTRSRFVRIQSMDIRVEPVVLVSSVT